MDSKFDFLEERAFLFECFLENNIQKFQQIVQRCINEKGKHVLEEIYLDLEGVILETRYHFFKYLFNLGLDIEVLNGKNYSPLMNASYFGNKELVEYLCSLGAEVNKKGDHGETPLYLACDNKEICQILLENGADPNCIITSPCSDKFYSLLHHLCQNPYTSFSKKEGVIILLLSYGADPNILDSGGSKPIELLLGLQNTKHFQNLVDEFFSPEIKEPDFF